jgi:hypothetical protein
MRTEGLAMKGKGKIIMWVAIYAVLAYVYPPLRPGPALHSIAAFLQSIQAGQ